MKSKLLALLRGRIETTRAYAHGEVRRVPLSEWLALVLGKHSPLLRTSQDIKAFAFILSVSGGAVVMIVSVLHQV